MLCLGVFSIGTSKSDPNLGAILSKLLFNRPFHTQEYAQSSRLARQVSQHPNRESYSYANPYHMIQISNSPDSFCHRRMVER